MSEAVQGLLDTATAEGIFPAARAEVWLDGRPVFSGGAGGVDSSALFDLASLTKPMATAALVLSLWREHALSPDTPLSAFFPDAPVARDGRTLGDLLLHRSGLPAFAPCFLKVMRWYPRLFEADCPAMLRDEARKDMVRLVLAIEPTAPSGQAAVYSDLGYIVAGELLARAGGSSLERLFLERVAAPLRLSAHFRKLSALPSDVPLPLATGTVRPREPAPEQIGAWEPFEPHASRAGEVDDDNAWALDGVSGHAGLFGTASDVARFGQEVLDGLAGRGVLAPSTLWSFATALDRRTPGSTRTLGFDTPAPPSSAGRLLGSRAPGAVGHLGFTGCSLWVDLARQLVVALCTNRTLPGRGEVRIRAFRPRFHDAVVEAFCP